MFANLHEIVLLELGKFLCSNDCVLKYCVLEWKLKDFPGEKMHNQTLNMAKMYPLFHYFKFAISLWSYKLKKH